MNTERVPFIFGGYGTTAQQSILTGSYIVLAKSAGFSVLNLSPSQGSSDNCDHELNEDIFLKRPVITRKVMRLW